MMEVGGADTCIYGASKRTQYVRILISRKKLTGKEKFVTVMDKFLFICQLLVLLYERQLINTHTQSSTPTHHQVLISLAN